MLFDKICRHNGITHRLTQPASPTTTGKIERFHQTLRRELLDDASTVRSRWRRRRRRSTTCVAEYNADRPHQALDPQLPVTPAERFPPVPTSSGLLPLWLPPSWPPRPTLPPTSDSAATARIGQRRRRRRRRVAWAGGPVEFDRVVPPSGNMSVAGRQFWLGPPRAGQMVRSGPDVDVIHLLIGGARVKTRALAPDRADLARWPPRARSTPARPRCHRSSDGDGGRGRSGRVHSSGTVALGGTASLAAEILGGPPGRYPDRSRHADVLRPRHPRAAPRPAEPAHPRPRSSGSAAPAPPARRPGPRPNPSASNDGPRTPA